MTKFFIQISRQINTCLTTLLNWFTEKVFLKLQIVLQREKGFIIKQCMSCLSLLLFIICDLHVSQRTT